MSRYRRSGRSITQSVEVDVGLEEFETEALLEELKSRDVEPEMALPFVEVYAAVLAGHYGEAKLLLERSLSSGEIANARARARSMAVRGELAA